MTDDLFKKCHEYAAHMIGLSGVPCSVFDVVTREFVYQADASFCHYCKSTGCEVRNTYFYGCNEAFRWNGRYIYYCPAGLVLVSSSILDESGAFTAGLLAGPLIMGSVEDMLEDMSFPLLRDNLQNLPSLSVKQVNALAAVMAAVTSYISGTPHNNAMTSVVYEQDKLLNTLYNVKSQISTENTYAYPIDIEKKLQAMIISRDKKGSQLMLNELLGHIYFSTDFNLDLIKSRVLELVVIISRATIDAGADLSEIFWYNTNFIKEIERFHSIEDLSVWITGVMHRFINYSFDFTNIKHSDIVFKVMEYVKAHYSQKISLDDIAKYVNLSKSYLSRVFKDETGESLSVYMNKVRVEKSKLMLLEGSASLVDIANLAGFEDQSYFTKVFKKITGTSPKRFRESRGHITDF